MISGWKTYSDVEHEFEATIDLIISKFYLPTETNAKTTQEILGFIKRPTYKLERVGNLNS